MRTGQPMRNPHPGRPAQTIHSPLWNPAWLEKGRMPWGLSVVPSGESPPRGHHSRVVGCRTRGSGRAQCVWAGARCGSSSVLWAVGVRVIAAGCPGGRSRSMGFPQTVQGGCMRCPPGVLSRARFATPCPARGPAGGVGARGVAACRWREVRGRRSGSRCCSWLCRWRFWRLGCLRVGVRSSWRRVPVLLVVRAGAGGGCSGRTRGLVRVWCRW